MRIMIVIEADFAIKLFHGGVNSNFDSFCVRLHAPLQNSSKIAISLDTICYKKLLVLQFTHEIYHTARVAQ